MKILIAPNTFKGTITANDVATAIKDGFLNVTKDLEILCYPISDGGDCSLDTMLEIFGGIRMYSNSINPIGEKIEVSWALLNNNKAFIETALTFGLALLPKHKRNPYLTTSRGVGELIKTGLDFGIRDFIIGVGGSANNDAGSGMMKSLGVKYLDKSNKELLDGGIFLNKLFYIDTSKIDSRLKESKFLFLSDSSVPLIGDKGVSILYSPGKGASKKMAYNLDKSLLHYTKVVKKQFNTDIRNKPMSGSGGGIISAAELFMDTSSKYGIEFILQELNLIEKLQGVDLVITGEGQLDEQTIYNKAPYGIAKLAKTFKIPVISINAKLGDGYEKAFDNYIDIIASISGENGWTKGIVNEKDIYIASRDIFIQYLSRIEQKKDIKGLICTKQLID